MGWWDFDDLTAELESPLYVLLICSMAQIYPEVRETNCTIRGVKKLPKRLPAICSYLRNLNLENNLITRRL
jgi:hypothetical protein